MSEQTGCPGMQQIHLIGNYMREFFLKQPDSQKPRQQICLLPGCHQLPQYIARSKQFFNKCNVAELEQNVRFCIPIFQLDRLGEKQISTGKYRNNDTSDNHMADTTLVYSPTRNLHTTLIVFTSTTKAINKSPDRKTSTCENQIPKVSGVGNFRNTQEIKGISSNVAKCISMSRRSVSFAGYQSVGTNGFDGVANSKLIQLVYL